MINPGRFKGFGKNFQNMGCGWFALCGFLALFFVVPVLNFHIANLIIEMICFWTEIEFRQAAIFLYSPISVVSLIGIALSKTNRLFSFSSGMFIFSTSYLLSFFIDLIDESPEVRIVPAYLVCGLMVFVIGNFKYWFGLKRSEETE